MRDLDQPVGEAAVQECGDGMMGAMSPMSSPMPSPMNDQPPPSHPSMSVNLNAQGMDNIESLLKLMTKVNPDMINQPTGMSPTMPGLSPAAPSIVSIKPDNGYDGPGPLKMLPDLDKEPDDMMNPPGIDIDAGPDLDNDEGPEMDNDNQGPEDDDKKEKDEAAVEPEGDDDDIMTHLNKELKPYDDQVAKDSEKEEAYGNSAPGSDGPDYQGIDAAIPDGNDLNKPKKTFPKVAGGDNPMQRTQESTDLRTQIRDELRRRLAEAKGAK